MVFSEQVLSPDSRTEEMGRSLSISKDKAIWTHSVNQSLLFSKTKMKNVGFYSVKPTKQWILFICG